MNYSEKISSLLDKGVLVTPDMLDKEVSDEDMKKLEDKQKKEKEDDNQNNSTTTDNNSKVKILYSYNIKSKNILYIDLKDWKL